MPPISFSGIGAGFDTGAVVDALVAAARLPIDRLETRKQDTSRQITLLSDIMNQLSTLKSAAEKLDTAAEFRNFSATSSNETALAASAGSDAMSGTYQIDVVALAQAERTYSTTFVNKDQTGAGFGAGTLSIQVGSNPAVNIVVDDATDTLESVAQKINSSGADVNASIVFDGSQYRLLVQGTKTGAANAVAFTETAGLTLALTNEVQVASDAQITVDTLTVTSETNTVVDAIPGVTLNLKQTSATPVSVEISTDHAAVEADISGIIDAYNRVALSINRQFSFTGTPRGDTLIGDSALRSAKRGLQTLLSSEVASVTGDYNALSRVGLSTERDGTLKLDGAALKDALADDFDGVMQLFTAVDGIAPQLVQRVENLIQEPDGLLAARKDGLGDAIDNIDDRIASLERRAESYEEALRRQFTALEGVMAELNSQGGFLGQAL